MPLLLFPSTFPPIDTHFREDGGCNVDDTSDEFVF